MPHLSPMKWCMMLISFWLLLSIISSMNWWNQLPAWQNLNSSSNKSTINWKW